MSSSFSAEEQLQTIRRLMERATIYRSISVPTAFWAGVFAIMLSGFFYWKGQNPESSLISVSFFALSWCGVLLGVLVLNGYFLLRGKQEATFFSPGMKLALRAVFPSFLVAGLYTVGVVTLEGRTDLLVLGWIIFYGLGLVATQEFSPRSICLLGWAFLMAGLVLGALMVLLESKNNEICFNPSGAMAATFGLFHLVYAGAVAFAEKQSKLSSSPNAGSDHDIKKKAND